MGSLAWYWTFPAITDDDTATPGAVSPEIGSIAWYRTLDDREFATREAGPGGSATELVVGALAWHQHMHNQAQAEIRRSRQSGSQ